MLAKRPSLNVANHTKPCALSALPLPAFSPLGRKATDQQIHSCLGISQELEKVSTGLVQMCHDGGSGRWPVSPSEGQEWLERGSHQFPRMEDNAALSSMGPRILHPAQIHPFDSFAGAQVRLTRLEEGAPKGSCPCVRMAGWEAEGDLIPLLRFHSMSLCT